MLRRFSCTVFALLLVCCGSQQSTVPPTVPPIGTNSLLWQIDRDSSPPNYWSRANDGECGSITFPTDTSVKFAFSQGSSPSGGNCSRDQMNPYSGPGQIFRLTPGKVYTWKFQVAAQGNVDTLLWQIHVYNAGQNGCGTSPGAGLSVGKHNGQMMWDLWDLGPDTYFPGFVPNQPASWTVVAKISQGSDGYTSYNLNGKRLFTYHKQNVPSPPCDASPFWNYGPYVPTWIYTLPSGLSTEDDYGYMKLYTQ